MSLESISYEYQYLLVPILEHKSNLHHDMLSIELTVSWVRQTAWFQLYKKFAKACFWLRSISIDRNSIRFPCRRRWTKRCWKRTSSQMESSITCKRSSVLEAELLLNVSFQMAMVYIETRVCPTGPHRASSTIKMCLSSLRGHWASSPKADERATRFD